VQRYEEKLKNEHETLKKLLETCTIRNNYVILQPELTNYNNKNNIEQ